MLGFLSVPACWCVSRVLRELLAVSLLGLACLGSANAQCVKTVRWYDDAPYSFKSPDGKVIGLYADIARVALKGMNCDVRFVEMPWARALHELQQGRLDILPGTLHKPDREKFAYFTLPINRSPNVLFVAKRALDNYKLKDLADIVGTGFRLGAQIGVAYGPGYDALAKTRVFSEQITTVTSRRGAWKMIDQGRLDGLIADEVTALVELQQMGLSNRVVKTDIVVSVGPAMFALSRASLSQEFLAEFNRSLNAMKADGRYKKIFESYAPCLASATNPGCR